ncbi:major facilitator superfamily transporter [Ophiostoma piceae UAMH 11346]|uniref:Major facilitator superfamily transporter n=1 Tax=Ophiostoma piceae (strain UAMH 11346) TaxID=1262450 RepID=S3CFH7_OPHP1|nr:major facilitator superfamily transporter [Ophiostoma piceae UAMH 11346]
MTTRIVKYVFRESGLASVYTTGLDAWVIILARSCRMFSYGASSLILALFFAELKVSDERIGLFMTLTLAGDVGLGLLLTLVADQVGRRRTIILGSVLMMMSGATFALCENYWLLLMAAIIGVISATGSDFGPFRAVEESILSEVTNPATRADVLVWYVTTSAVGTSLGTEVAGRLIHYMESEPEKGGLGWPLLKAYHVCYWAYAAMGLMNLLLCLVLSKRTELRGGQIQEIDSPATDSTNDIPLSSRPSSSSRKSRKSRDTATVGGSSSGASSETDSISIGSSKIDRKKRDEGSVGDSDIDSDIDFEDDDLEPSPAPAAAPAQKKSRFSQISKQTRSIMYSMWFLLMVDSLADGMANISLTTYYLDFKFHMSKDSLGNILSISYLCAAVMNITAGPLSRYIGLVNTMVFTHVPSSAAVLLFPFPSSIGITYAFLVLRIALNSLDQAPRAALIAAIVKPEERTAVMGITSLLRTLASTTGPSLTGLLAGHDRFWIAFVVAGALRLAYDFGLFAMFVNIRLYQHEPDAIQPLSAGGDATVTRGEYSTVPGHPDAFVLDEEESIEGEGGR